MKIRAGKRVLFSRVKVCSSVLDKMLGIMGRRRPIGRAECLLFTEEREAGPISASIHMAFCFLPITVAWLDGEGRVVDVAQAVPFSLLAPATWRIYAPSSPARYIIECRAGTKLTKGQKLELF